jgi:hypothetical protein
MKKMKSISEMSRSEFQKHVGGKINKFKTNLSQGVDQMGFAYRAHRLTTSLENLYFSLGNEVHDPVEAAFQAFSARPGLNDVSNSYAVDIVDIAITAADLVMLTRTVFFATSGPRSTV